MEIPWTKKQLMDANIKLLEKNKKLSEENKWLKEKLERFRNHIANNTIQRTR